MAKLTIKDIARICGVGTSTVSRAINGDAGINKETKARILSTIEEYGFVPNSSARSLKLIESKTIALIIKGNNNPFFEKLFGMFAEQLKTLEYSLVIQPVDIDEDEIDVAAKLLNEKRLRGIIFLGGLLDDAASRLDGLGVPYVRCTGATDRFATGQNGSSISVDDAKESYRAVDYLCKCGHKRIAIISTKENDNSIGTIRLNGYKKALLDNGIEPAKELICHAIEGLNAFSADCGYELTSKLIRDGVDFTALVCSSDMNALGAYKAIRDAGKSIPDDYSIIGFDGLEMTKYYYPALTTVEQPSDELVRATIDQLMRSINGEEVEQTKLLRAKIVERDSVKKL